ncbi:hypothetical protein EDC01DRAFT_634076 [Geopyxis carbonaria]|nr:hypothetical protein EDC01DRAFT_634076 [Geopyxis carbonaria]
MPFPQHQLKTEWSIEETDPYQPDIINFEANFECRPISTLSDDPYRYDNRFLEKRLQEDRERLFTSWNNINVGVLNVRNEDLPELDRKPWDVNTSEILESWFACPIEPTNSRFYLIKPSNPKVYSWSPLHISEEITRKLLHTYKVMPAFLDCLHSGGEKTNDICATYAGCRYRFNYRKPRPQSQGLIVTFGTGRVVQSYAKSGRRRSGPTLFQWSIRETSIYQKYDNTLKSNIWILVKASQRMEERINEVNVERQGFQDTERFEVNPMNMHLVFLSAASENWRSYYNSMEEYFRDKTMNAVDYIIRSRLGEPLGCLPVGRTSREPSNDLQVDFRDVQELQKFEEDVQKLVSHLEDNQSVLKSLKDLNVRFHKECAANGVDDGSILRDDFNITLEAHEAEIEANKRKADGLLLRVRGRSRLLYNVLEFRTQEAVSQHNERSQELQELKRRDSEIVKKMNKKTLEDAVGVKIMTFVALLYLPLTFVATFLNSGILKFGDSRSDVDFHRVGFSKESFILFVAMAVPLLALTLGGWYKWNKRELAAMEENYDPEQLNEI